MHAGPQSLLDRPYGPLYLADVTVGGDNVHLDWTHFLADALELAVGVNVANRETSCFVALDNCRDFL